MKALIVVLLLIAVPAWSSSKPAPKAPCRPSCTKKNCGQVSAKPTPTIWDQLVSGLELSAGWRWETDHECPTLVYVPPTHHTKVVDPFYLGVGLRLPLAAKVSAFGEFDRDWTEAARWQTRAGISVTPFKH